ncbi:MAG: hypothetical protein HY985_18110 [Magnetospirillum sp.]|nr:hypothetical protein [Magnetospirillum sp.]
MSRIVVLIIRVSQGGSVLIVSGQKMAYYFARILVAAVVIVNCGCAMPSPGVRGLSPVPEFTESTVDGQGVVQFRRTGCAGLGCALGITLVIDGTDVATLTRDTYFEFRIQPGARHEVWTEYLNTGRLIPKVVATEKLIIESIPPVVTKYSVNVAGIKPYVGEGRERLISTPSSGLR